MIKMSIEYEKGFKKNSPEGSSNTHNLQSACMQFCIHAILHINFKFPFTDSFLFVARIKTNQTLKNTDLFKKPW